MWIPRFAYNAQGEILYIKQGSSVAGTYAIPEIFTYETEKRDFSLAGIWVEYNPLTSTSAVNTKINNMQGPENKYGFIANTQGINANNETTYQTTIETYINKLTANVVGVVDLGDPITDISNTNRSILKITNTNQIEPIKAKAYYDTSKGKIKIEVTYKTNTIEKILDVNGKELSANSTTADTGEEPIGNKNYKFIIIDNQGNLKQATVNVSGLDIYIIENEEDLKLFRDAVNANKTTANTKAYQIADIKMNEGKYEIDKDSGEITFNSDAEQWEPISIYNSKSYRGEYHGNNHTISGIYINTTGNYVGLFGYISENCLIEDLKIIQSSIKGTNNVGGIVGAAVGKSNINNCSNEATIQATEDKVGGIVGAYTPDKEWTLINIKNCYNAGKINGRQYVGGIVGYSNISANVDKYIEECYNCGNIEGTSYLGGISGYNAGINIRYCYNTGTIKGNGTCGGISGSSRSTVENCYNIGNIYSNSYAGGICGELNKLNQVGDLRFCYNIGSIIGGTGSIRIGGIVGHISSSYEGYSVNATEEIIGDRYVGAICGSIGGTSTGCSYNNFIQVNTSFNAIGYGTTLNGNDNVAHSDISSMPTIMDVINESDIFVEDTEGINNGYPILAWQAQ